MATFKAGPAHPSRSPRPRSSLPGRQRRGRHPAAFLTLVRSPIRSFVPIFILGTHFCSLMVCNAPGERQRVREQRRRRGRPCPRLTRREGGREGEGVPVPEPWNQNRAVAVAHRTYPSSWPQHARPAYDGRRKVQVPGCQRTT